MKYPINIKKRKNSILYGNRGMDLEDSLNLANNYYSENKIAFIYKKPTPIGIVQTGYENNNYIIKKAYFKEPSTLDYNGLYKGNYVEFEAKETKNKTSFPLANIHEHQINHMKNIYEHKGIVFLIIKMNNYFYLLKGEDFLDYLNKCDRKSIPYEYIQEKGFLIKENFNGLDYLNGIDRAYFGGTYEKD